MDILRVLSAPDLEVRKKTLSLALDLVSSRNIEEACLIFKYHHPPAAFMYFLVLCVAILYFV